MPTARLWPLVLLLTLAAPAGAQADSTVTALTFYVGGHQDDWQLFRGNAAHTDLTTPGTRVVFLYATAGDAGRTDGWWEARERGALESVRAVRWDQPDPDVPVCAE